MVKLILTTDEDGYQALECLWYSDNGKFVIVEAIKELVREVAEYNTKLTRK